MSLHDRGLVTDTCCRCHNIKNDWHFHVHFYGLDASLRFPCKVFVDYASIDIATTKGAKILELFDESEGSKYLQSMAKHKKKDPE